MSPGPCGSLATQPVLSVAGQQSAGAAFGLRIEEWMVGERERERERRPVEADRCGLYSLTLAHGSLPSPFTTPPF